MGEMKLNDAIWRRKRGACGGPLPERCRQAMVYLRGSGTLVDVGCGDGRFTQLAGRRYNKTVGLDGSREALKMAVEKNIQHIGDLLFRGTGPKTSQDPEGYDGGHLHYFTSRDLVSLLEDAGFQVESVGGVAPRFYRSAKVRLFYQLSKLWEREPVREFFSRGIVVCGVK